VKKAIVFLVALTASGAAFAGVRLGIGIGFGFPGYWGPGPYWAPAYYPPPAYYYPPPPPAYYYPPPPPQPVPARAPAPAAAPAAAAAWPPVIVPGEHKTWDDFRGDDNDCRGQSVSDVSYQQCMLARGHKIATSYTAPVPAPRYSAPTPAPVPPAPPPSLPN